VSENENKLQEMKELYARMLGGLEIKKDEEKECLRSEM
jgi:hypothetical protein